MSLIIDIEDSSGSMQKSTVIPYNKNVLLCALLEPKYLKQVEIDNIVKTAQNIKKNGETINLQLFSAVGSIVRSFYWEVSNMHGKDHQEKINQNLLILLDTIYPLETLKNIKNNFKKERDFLVNALFFENTLENSNFNNHEKLDKYYNLILDFFNNIFTKEQIMDSFNHVNTNLLSQSRLDKLNQRIIQAEKVILNYQIKTQSQRKSLVL